MARFWQRDHSLYHRQFCPDLLGFCLNCMFVWLLSRISCSPPAALLILRLLFCVHKTAAVVLTFFFFFLQGPYQSSSNNIMPGVVSINEMILAAICNLLFVLFKIVFLWPWGLMAAAVKQEPLELQDSLKATTPGRGLSGFGCGNLRHTLAVRMQ